MDYLTDTGCMEPDREENTPLSEQPDAQAGLMASLKALSQQVSQLQKLQEQHEARIRQLESSNLLLSSVVSQFLGSETTLHPPVVPQPPPPDVEALPALHQAFAFNLRHDSRRAKKMVRVLREQIAPVACCTSQRLFRWCHVRRVLIDRRLMVENVSPTDFGRAMAQVLGGSAKAENIRKAAEGYDMPRGCYLDWRDGQPDREACLEVEFLLGDLIQ